MIRSTAGACLRLGFIMLSSCSGNSTVLRVEENRSKPQIGCNLITVTGRSVNLRSGPGTEFGILGQVHEGDSLQVTGGLDDWYRIYIPSMSLFAWIYGPLTSGTVLP